VTDAELHWLAGILEGEGSFMRGPPSHPNQPGISISMTDRDVIERVRVLFGMSYVQCGDKRPGKWKPHYAVRVRGNSAVVLMKKLRPLMGQRRQGQIDRAIASWVPKKTKLTVEQARYIKHELEHGVPAYSLAQRFNVSHITIRRIRDRKLWKAA
jgi:hypothetical protein